MRSWVCAVTVAAAALMLAIFPHAALAEDTIVGHWLGKLAISGLELRIATEFKRSPDGSYSGTFQSLDQGGQIMPLNVVKLDSNKLHFELSIAHLTWDGTLKANGSALEGSMTQGASTLPLNFKRIESAPALTRPQEPKKPYPYKETEVLYDNHVSGFKIGGTLTVPEGQGPFPAVLLITGSGQQNRNEELLGHKPFLIIADYLTRRGIAVLRVDDRGAGTSTGDFAKATTADFATDVEAGIAFLKSRSEVRKDKIGLIGHSEGGVIAPMVAARSKDTAFIVMLAGTGVTGAEVLNLQGETINRAAGASEDGLKFNRALNEAFFKIIREEKDPAAAAPKLRAAYDAAVATLPEAARKRVEGTREAAVASTNAPWMRYFITYDPATALRKVKCPVLAMNGSKDMQVIPEQNLPAITAALKAGGNTDYTIKLLPGLNHLFQNCTTGAPSEYSSIEETFAPAALKVMGDWIVAHTK